MNLGLFLDWRIIKMILYELAQQIGGKCHGNRDIEITGLGTLDSAGKSEITFLALKGRREALKNCKAFKQNFSQRFFRFTITIVLNPKTCLKNKSL